MSIVPKLVKPVSQSPGSDPNNNTPMDNTGCPPVEGPPWPQSFVWRKPISGGGTQQQTFRFLKEEAGVPIYYFVWTTK